MKRPLPSPVISVPQMRRWEKASWSAGRSAADVIDKVGQKVARRLEQIARPGEKILFMAGHGHNGDDTRAARKHLDPARESFLLEAANPASARAQFADAVKGCSWIVDGLFGIGLNRPLDAQWRRLIGAVNSAGIPIIAVDVPSGLNADLGEPEGASMVADVTLTIAGAKRGLLKAARYVGRLEVLTDVGLIECPFRSDLNWTMPGDFAGWPLRRPVESNKGTFGHAAIFAGSFGYHGAAVLAGQGAARAQPGLVTLYPQESVYGPVAAQCRATMVHAWRPAQTLPKTCSAILFGPGLAAPELLEVLKNEMRTHWQRAKIPVVADASGLDWLPRGATPRGGIRVITPHPGEAGRLLGCSAAAVQKERLRALRRLSRRFGNCWVVLKGHQTLVGRNTGNVFINSSGNPFLAQGGSGDLLGGFITGLLAQPEWQNDPGTAIRYAVWHHGAAADRLSAARNNWTIEDLSKCLGEK